MKDVPNLEDWDKLVAEKRKIMEDEAVNLVMQHKINMLTCKRNAGVRAAYKAYQALLPFSLRIPVPVLKTKVVIYHNYQTFKEAKELLITANSIEMIMTDEIKTAQEQYEIMLGLAR